MSSVIQSFELSTDVNIVHTPYLHTPCLCRGFMHLLVGSIRPDTNQSDILSNQALTVIRY